MLHPERYKKYDIDLAEPSADERALSDAAVREALHLARASGDSCAIEQPPSRPGEGGGAGGGIDPRVTFVRSTRFELDRTLEAKIAEFAFSIENPEGG